MAMPALPRARAALDIAARVLEAAERRPFHAGVAALGAGLAAAERPTRAAPPALACGAGPPAPRRPRLAPLLVIALSLGAPVGSARLQAIDSQARAARPRTSVDATATLLE